MIFIFKPIIILKFYLFFGKIFFKLFMYIITNLFLIIIFIFKPIIIQKFFFDLENFIFDFKLKTKLFFEDYLIFF